MSEPYESQLQRAKQVDEIGEDFDICPDCYGRGRVPASEMVNLAAFILTGKQQGTTICRRCNGDRVVPREQLWTADAEIGLEDLGEAN